MATKVVVHQRAIQSLFNPGGGVNRFGTRVARDTTLGAKAWALQHARTGTLARSLSTRSNTSRYSVTFTTYSTAEYARHLEYGTSAQSGVVLYQDVLRGARSPLAARGYTAFIGARMGRVEGSPRTRFMSRALDKALAKHGLA